MSVIKKVIWTAPSIAEDTEITFDNERDAAIQDAIEDGTESLLDNLTANRDMCSGGVDWLREYMFTNSPENLIHETEETKMKGYKGHMFLIIADLMAAHAKKIRAAMKVKES